MAILFWQAGAVIAAQTAYAPPAAAGAPRLLGVRKAVIMPQASGVSTPTLFEAGQASGAGLPSAGNIQVDVVQQKFISGDAIPAEAVLLIDAIAAGEQPLNP